MGPTRNMGLTVQFYRRTWTIPVPQSKQNPKSDIKKSPMGLPVDRILGTHGKGLISKNADCKGQPSGTCFKQSDKGRKGTKQTPAAKQYRGWTKSCTTLKTTAEPTTFVGIYVGESDQKPGFQAGRRGNWEPTQRRCGPAMRLPSLLAEARHPCGEAQSLSAAQHLGSGGRLSGCISGWCSVGSVEMNPGVPSNKTRRDGL